MFLMNMREILTHFNELKTLISSIIPRILNIYQERISPKNMADDIKQSIAMYLLCSKHKCDFLKVQT